MRLLYISLCLLQAVFNEIISLSRLESLCHFCAAHISLSPPFREATVLASALLEEGSWVVHPPSRLHAKGSETGSPWGSQWGLSSVRTPNGSPSCFKHVKSQYETRFGHSSLHTIFKSRDEKGSCSYSQQVGKARG